MRRLLWGADCARLGALCASSGAHEYPGGGLLYGSDYDAADEGSELVEGLIVVLACRAEGRCQDAALRGRGRRGPSRRASRCPWSARSRVRSAWSTVQRNFTMRPSAHRWSTQMTPFYDRCKP